VTHPLSLQLYTLREALATDLPGTLQRVSDLGFRTVELFGFVDDAERFRDALAAASLPASSAHAGFIAAGGDVTPVLDAAAVAGVPVVIDPAVPPERWTERDSVAQIAATLNAAAEVAADRGIVVGYHNHAWELENRIDGTPALEVLADLLDDAVVLEVDTYWAQVGGVPAVELLGRLGERVRLLHVKDGPISPENKEQTAVGHGRMPIRAILDAAPEAVRVVELDDFDGDMFSAVEDSIRTLTQMGENR
jgi:sugar phosphate isomerase/epimerase